MEDLKLLSLSDLLDLLIEQTTYHTQLISKGASGEQFRISRETMKRLQGEITLRKLAEKTDQTILPSQDDSSVGMAS